MRMRINLKFLLVILIVLGTITTLTYWIRCGDVTSAPFDHLDRSNPKVGMKGNLYSLDSEDDNFSENDASPLVQEGVPWIRTRGGLKTLDDIDCLINEEYTVSCKQEDGEVFIPFTFLHEYFEVYGKVVQHNDEKHFEWQHSYSKVYHPRGKYDPHGVFMWFENYNVGVRDRVLCISGAEGVPVSTQWDPQGHLYPIQIAQFGLSHFSKNLTEKTPSIKLLDAGEIFPSAQWTMLTNGQTKSPLKRVLEKTTQKKVLEFKTDE